MFSFANAHFLNENESNQNFFQNSHRFVLFSYDLDRVTCFDCDQSYVWYCQLHRPKCACIYAFIFTVWNLDQLHPLVFLLLFYHFRFSFSPSLSLSLLIINLLNVFFYRSLFLPLHIFIVVFLIN